MADGARCVIHVRTGRYLALAVPATVPPDRRSLAAYELDVSFAPAIRQRVNAPLAVEVRDGYSLVLILPQYQLPHTNRVLEAMWEGLPPYPEYPGREHWTDRVFYQSEDGATRALRSRSAGLRREQRNPAGGGHCVGRPRIKCRLTSASVCPANDDARIKGGQEVH
jgi:hypothetical protein